MPLSASLTYLLHLQFWIYGYIGTSRFPINSSYKVLISSWVSWSGDSFNHQNLPTTKSLHLLLPLTSAISTATKKLSGQEAEQETRMCDWRDGATTRMACGPVELNPQIHCCCLNCCCGQSSERRTACKAPSVLRSARRPGFRPPIPGGCGRIP